MKFNPFTPNSIVNPGMFAGRFSELETLERVLTQTKFGNPQHFVINGEKGIGKSSLILYVDAIAQGRVPTMTQQTLQFLTVNIELEPTTTYVEIIKKVGSELSRVIAAHNRIEESLKKGWDFLKRWEVFGVKYDVGSEKSLEPHELLEDLTFTMAEIVSKGIASGSFEGVIVTIDEADKPGATANLGMFCKLFTERLTKRGCNNVALGLAGLPKLVGQLRASHESAPRIFEDVPLEPLLPEDRKRVVRLGLAKANEKNTTATTITEAAEELISTLSEGYPHFVQQFAYCAFDEDKDDKIDDNDVMQGAFRKNGAIQQLGTKYFHELYWEQISSDEYRSVLRAMSEHFDNCVTKKQLKKATGLSETTLTNALSSLKSKNIILAKTGERGVYRLPTRSFAVWIKASTSASTAVSVDKSSA